MIKKIIKNVMVYFTKGNVGLNDFKKYALNHSAELQVDGFFHKYEGEMLEKYFDQIKEKLGSLIRKNDVILEIGCGTGRYLKYIEAKLGTDVKLYGTDITRETIENITQKNVSPAVNLYVGDFIKEANFKGGQFDFLYSISVLQYVPFFKISAYFNKVKELLKNGGTSYLIFAPKKNKLPNFINSLTDFSFTAYDPEWIIRKLNKKFTVIERDYIYVDGNVYGYYILFRN